jgi:NAD(P)-dependent dehydrogenase (short-subunit alcohol dehydrogenase family)
MGERLNGKVAVVTGSGRGIGRGEALAMAQEGAKIVVNDIGAGPDGSGQDGSPAHLVVEEIRSMGGEAVANYDSVTTERGGANIIQTAIDNFGQIDILVNNAGILRDKMVFNMTDEEWDSVIKVHLYGHFFTTKHAAIHFRKQRSGRIINTSSISGLGASFGQCNYGAAKEGIIGFTRQVAGDLGRYGVTCNAIRPAAATRLSYTEELVQAWRKAGVPEHLIAGLASLKPEDISPLVVWLASGDAYNVNGRTFYVETGKVALYSEPVEEKALFKSGAFTTDELFAAMPKTLAKDLKNPHPPKEQY